MMCIIGGALWVLLESCLSPTLGIERRLFGKNESVIGPKERIESSLAIAFPSSRLRL